MIKNGLADELFAFIDATKGWKEESIKTCGVYVDWDIITIAMVQNKLPSAGIDKIFNLVHYKIKKEEFIQIYKEACKYGYTDLA
jgi:hypothetical protein